MQNTTRCSWFYDHVTNDKKCITDKMKTKQSVDSYADQLTAQLNITLYAQTFSWSRVHAELRATRCRVIQPGLDEKQHSWK